VQKARRQKHGTQSEPAVWYKPPSFKKGGGRQLIEKELQMKKERLEKKGGRKEESIRGVS